MIGIKDILEDVDNNPFKNNAIEGGLVSIFRTIGCIGDSLASGEHEYLLPNGTRGYYDMYEYSWGQFIARKCGNTVYNFSRGGLKARTFLEYANYCGTFYPEKRCQAYIVALGVNDMNHLDDVYPDGFGSMEDVDFDNYENNKISFVGQYTKILQKIVELEPRAKIFLMTLPKGIDTSIPYEKLKVKHTEFLRGLPKYFKNAYVLDFNKYVKPFDSEFKKIYFTGSHMNAMGYKLVADMVTNCIDYIIQNNYRDFKTVAFIGKETHLDLDEFDERFRKDKEEADKKILEEMNKKDKN